MDLDGTQKTMTGQSFAMGREPQEIEEVGGRSRPTVNTRDSSEGPGESLHTVDHDFA